MAKYIIIKQENADKIMAKFKEIQGKATSRVIGSFEELEDIVIDIDDRIGDMPKTAKNGTTAEYNFQQHFPNAYGHAPISTHFTLIYDKGTWKIDIDSINRDFCPNRKKYYKYNLKLSETAKAKILERYE